MKLKRILAAGLALLICLTPSAFAAQSKTITVDPIDVMVGGKVFLPTDVNGNNVPVFVYNGTTYAPLRAVAEAYGLTVSYNAEKNLGSISGTPSNNFVGTKGTAPALTGRTTLSVSSINIEVNGQVFQPKDVNGKPVDIFVYNGTTYAPLRAVAEAYGLAISYNQEKRLACIDFVSTSGTDFDSLLNEVNAAREAEIKSPFPFDGYTDYLVDDPATKNLLTSAEVSALLNTEDRNVQTVTVEQAISDIDLLFRSLHACYGAYYYFGEDAYDQAEAEVMAWLEGQTTVSVNKLTDVLRQSLSFMVDAHSFVGYQIDRLEGIRYEYHHCTGQQFDKDAQGYFKLINGQRVSFVSFSDDRVTMEPTLLSDGKIIYSPVLFCPTNQVASATIQLKRADGTIDTETLNWTPSKEVPFSNGEPNFQFVMENDLAYINIDKFNRSRYDEYYEALANTGKQVKSCKAVIFDLRANGGGTGNPTDEWVKNFTGHSSQVRQALAQRYSVFNSSNKQSLYEVDFLDRGKWLPNDIPVIVLVDDACGSSGEGALAILKTMDNVLVVGTNSAGFDLGGNTVQLTLPHTGIPANIGTMLRFRYEVKNVDCIGYTPDVWCESDMALDAALNLLLNAGVVNEQSIQPFRDALDKVVNQDEISIGIGSRIRKESAQFGASQGTHIATLYLNGEPTSDYSATSSNPSVCTVSKRADGTLAINVKGTGSTTITVRCGDTEANFYLTGK